MDKFTVQLALEALRVTRQAWRDGRRRFERDSKKVLDRLILEAAANYMSAEDVGRYVGMTAHEVRKRMDPLGMDGTMRKSKTLLAKHAAEALATNSDLLGIAPHEMDLMSPLAYLPAGSELRQRITDQSTAQVHELPVSGNYEHDDAAQLAGKLDDAGIEWEHAREWVNEVITRGVLIP